MPYLAIFSPKERFDVHLDLNQMQDVRNAWAHVTSNGLPGLLLTSEYTGQSGTTYWIPIGTFLRFQSGPSAT